MTKVSGKLINTREVADLLGVTTQTILNWVKNGVLKPFKSANNTMYFSRKYINAFIDEIEDLSGLDNALEQYKSEIRHAIKERDEKLNLLRKEIAWRNTYAFNRYAKVISSVAERLVDIGELRLSENEKKVLYALLSLEPMDVLAKELHLSYARIGQIMTRLYAKLSHVDAQRTRYDRLKKENEELRLRLLQVTTEKETNANGCILSKPIDKCDFSVRTENVFRRIDVRTLGDLAMLSERYLLSCRGFGTLCLKEVKKKLKEYNITLNKA